MSKNPAHKICQPTREALYRGWCEGYVNIESINAIGAKFFSQSSNRGQQSFKEIFESKQKLVATKKINGSDAVYPIKTSNIAHDVFKKVVSDHERVNRTMESFMTKNNYSAAELLRVQYKTGVLFLREQMFSKAVEFSANSFKSLTQMQV